MVSNETRTTCPYCGVGCGVIVESRVDEVIAVRGDPQHPANFGRLCSKGSTLAQTMRPEIVAQLRALHPELRMSRDAPRERVEWSQALDHVATRIAETVLRHGPDSVGLYVSGQLLTEDYYVFNKLAKGLLGTNNIDTNSRLCMSSAVAGYKSTLGADSPPACYEDVDHADLLFIAGSNAAWAHPVLFRRIEEAKARNPAMKIVVVDPRKTETAHCADIHLAIEPGTDVALFHGLLHVLLWEGRIAHDWIAAHTSGFDALRDLVRDYTPKAVAGLCGISEADLLEVARCWGTSKAVLSLYCQGLNQSTSGTAKNAALINLHLATAQIGRPGAGPFSLTGQPNAMGGREVGGLANLLSAHRDLANPRHRAEVAALWGIDAVPERPGKTAVEMFESVRTGEIKVLWIVCTNPAQSLPNQRLVREALERAECVIVQEAYGSTATAGYADVLLPASSWAEKDGTVTNSERRISRVRAAVSAPGAAMPDWRIGVEVARRVEARLRPAKPTLFPYESAQDVWNEHRESTRGRDLDITALSYARLDVEGPQQWPCVAADAPGRVRLYEDGVFPTDDGRARFAATPFKAVAEPADARYPVRLTTGRLRDQWHGMSRTGTLGALFGHAPEPCVEVHPAELGRRGWRVGDLVRIASRRGALVLPVHSSDAVAPASAYVAMHWGDEFVGGKASDPGGVNALTQDAFDPVSKQPELKHAAVRIERVELPWRFVAFAWFDPAQAFDAQLRLRAAFGSFDAAHCVPFGDAKRTGMLFRAAAKAPVGRDVLERIDRCFGLAGPQAMRYDDVRRGMRRRLLVEAGVLRAVSLAGDATAESWLRASLEAATDVAAIGRALLLPSRVPPVAIAMRGPRVCQCHDVTASEIDAFLTGLAPAAAHDFDGALRALQSACGCGTSCGACLPEVRRAVRACASKAVA